MSEKLALYFGCLGGLGHFLHHPTEGRSFCEPIHGVSWEIGLIDGGLLRNRKVPDQPDGRVHVVPGGGHPLWYAFVWWDRSVDSRGASNSGFYVLGFCDVVTRESYLAGIAPAFAHACETWPDVVKRQPFPLVLVDPPLPPPPRSAADE